MTQSDVELSGKIIKFVNYITGYNQKSLGYIYSSTSNIEAIGLSSELRREIQKDVDNTIARLLVVFVFSTFEEFFGKKDIEKIHSLIDKPDSDKLKAYYHLRHSFTHMLSGRADTGYKEFDALMTSDARPRGIDIVDEEIVISPVFGVDMVEYISDIAKKALVRIHNPTQGLW